MLTIFAGLAQFERENLQFESEVYFKLKEAEKAYTLNGKTFSPKEVLKSIKDSTD